MILVSTKEIINTNTATNNLYEKIIITYKCITNTIEEIKNLIEMKLFTNIL